MRTYKIGISVKRNNGASVLIVTPKTKSEYQYPFEFKKLRVPIQANNFGFSLDFEHSQKDTETKPYDASSVSRAQSLFLKDFERSLKGKRLKVIIGSLDGSVEEERDLTLNPLEISFKTTVGEGDNYPQDYGYGRKGYLGARKIR